MPAARGRGVRDAGQPSCPEQDSVGGGRMPGCTGARGEGCRAAELPGTGLWRRGQEGRKGWMGLLEEYGRGDGCLLNYV